MTGRTKLPNPRRNGEPITLDWIRSNCRVEVTAVPMTECWTWLGALKFDGYGRVRSTGRGPMRLSHRMAYAISHGAIPDGMHLDHICRNRACCNPTHLEPATASENIHRGSHTGIAREVDPRCLKCGGVRTYVRRRSGRPPSVRCADCKDRDNRARIERKRMEASLA